MSESTVGVTEVRTRSGKNIWGVLAALILIAGGATFFLGSDDAQSGGLIEVGRLADFPEGEGREVSLDASFKPSDLVSEWDDLGLPEGEIKPIHMLISRIEDGAILALWSRDPHLGCRVGLAANLPSNLPLAEGAMFWNPCHGETYNAQGDCIEGPCPRGLDRFAVELSGQGQVSIDLDRFMIGPPRGSAYQPNGRRGSGDQ